MSSSYPQDPVIIQQNLNRDAVDGFRRHLRKLFTKLSCGRRIANSSGNENQPQQPTSYPEFDWNDDKYDFSHRKRGLAIIINNEDFSKCEHYENRLGSDKDASALYNTFILYGFHVQQYNDLKAWEMVEVLDAAAKYYNHEASDCFVCAVLTHGNYTEKTKEHLDLLFGVDEVAVSVNYLVETFNDTYCPALKDKPRLFFLQACRGQKCDDGQTVLVEKTEPTTPMDQGGGGDQLVKEKGLAVTLQESSLSSSDDEQLQHLALDKKDAFEDYDDESNPNGLVASYDRLNEALKSSKDPLPRPTPLYKDFLIMYAAPSGYTAWRNEDDGSWFVQTLCEVLNDTDLTSVDLLRALTRVNGLIARDFESDNDEYPQKKGLSVIETKLLKKIFMSKKTKETAADTSK